MFSLFFTTQFKKDLKKYLNKQKELRELDKVLKELENFGVVNKKYKPHQLINNYAQCMECHILSDFLLIWQVNEKDIHLIRVGTHSELFKK